MKYRWLPVPLPEERAELPERPAPAEQAVVVAKAVAGIFPIRCERGEQGDEPFEDGLWGHRASTTSTLNSATTSGGQAPERQLQELLDPAGFVGALLQDLYAAEVFLSLDAAQEGEAFFRIAPGQADTDATRLSRAVALGQILLLEKKHRAYADLATETLAPLLTRVLKPAPAGGRRDFLDAAALTEFVGGLALLPLGASEFLARLPDEQLQEMRPRWEKLRADAPDGSRPLLDLVLHGLYQATGREKERHEAAARLQGRPGLSSCPRTASWAR